MPRKINFTVDALARLRPADGKDRLWVYDAKTPRLAYLVTAAGSRSFYIYAKMAGRPVRYRLGDGTLSIELARRLCLAKSAEVQQGVDIQAKRQRERETIAASTTVGELWTRYRDDWLKAQARASTLTTDASLYTSTLAGWQSRRADTLTEGQCRHRHAEIGKAVGHRTANKAMQLLRRMLNWARLPNPITKGSINWFPEAERERFLNVDELRRFFAAVDREPSATLADYLRLAILTGARRSNLQQMRWSDVDFDARVWTVPAAESKNRQPLRIVLSAAALEILATRRDAIDPEKPGHEAWVFPSARRAGQHMTEPRFAFDRVCERAKLTDVRLHDLRRTFGSYQAMSGASELIIGKSLGHASREATRVYARLNMDPVRESVETATAVMLRAAGLEPLPVFHVTSIGHARTIRADGFRGEQGVRLTERPTFDGEPVDPAALPEGLALLTLLIAPAAIADYETTSDPAKGRREWRVPPAIANAHLTREGAAQP